jgi:translation initiation factor 3 subunit D
VSGQIRHFNGALEKTKPNAEILLPNLLEDVISSSTLEDLYLNKLI